MLNIAIYGPSPSFERLLIVRARVGGLGEFRRINYEFCVVTKLNFLQMITGGFAPPERSHITMCRSFFSFEVMGAILLLRPNQR